MSFSDEERAELIAALSRTAEMVAGLLDAWIFCASPSSRPPAERGRPGAAPRALGLVASTIGQAALAALGNDDRAADEGAVSECHCHQGWICEEHPDKPWPHDACAGPGTPAAIRTAHGGSIGRCRRHSTPATGRTLYLRSGPRSLGRWRRCSDPELHRSRPAWRDLAGGSVGFGWSSSRSPSKSWRDVLKRGAGGRDDQQ